MSPERLGLRGAGALPARVADLPPEELSRLYEALRGQRRVPPSEPIETTPGRDVWPLSFAQERLWFMEQVAPGNLAYNVTEAIGIEGELDVAALERSLAAIVERQASLRTVFRVHEGRPVQTIVPLDGPRLPVVDLAAVPEPERTAELARLVASDDARPFDLAAGPLFRLRLVRMASRRHVLVLTLHHIVTDGWSFGVLVEELGALYAGLVAGTSVALPPLPIQYGDFAAWQRERLRGPVLDDLLGYWRRRLAGAPFALEVPGARPRPSVPTYAGAHEEFSVPAAVSSALGQLGRSAAATTFMTLLAGFVVVLGERTGEDDVVVGTDVANRTLVETERLIGFFVNELVLRVDLSGNPSFAELLARVREVVVEAYAHQELPFQLLVADVAPRRRVDRNPLFQVLFVLQDRVLDRARLPGLSLTAETLNVQTQSSAFDLSVHVFETTADGFAGVMRYSTDRFDARMIAELIADYGVVLREAARGPEVRVDALRDAVARERARRRSSEREDLRAASARALRSTKRKAVAETERGGGV